MIAKVRSAMEINARALMLVVAMGSEHPAGMRRRVALAVTIAGIVATLQ
jgi:hypothetical protein